MKMLSFNEKTGKFIIREFYCARRTLVPPLSMCERQCKQCFELDAKMEFDVNAQRDIN